MSSDLIAAVLAQMRAQLDGLAGPGGDRLREMLCYHLGWEAQGADATGSPAARPAGKLVRPRLCLLSCQGVGGDPMAAVPAAAAVELIHSFSLIHDDIEDRDEMRRGRPAVWKRWGDAQAINAGDCMYSLAYAALSGLESAGADLDRRLRAATILSRACVRLCEGQSHDLALQEQQDISASEYLDLAGRKTGALMSCAAQMGAALGGADEKTQCAFCDFGFELGVSFQIRDDILGIWGDPDKTGKPVGADLARKRCSYPVVCALARAISGDEDRQAILAARDAPTATTAAAVAALERLGAREQAEESAVEAHRRAWSALQSLRLEPRAAQELRELTQFLAVRQY